jgi:adenylate cyclase class IV
VFDRNPFVEMLYLPGIVCGLFQTDRHTKVDRLDSTGKNFQVKVKQSKDNSEWFWGVLKFDTENIQTIINNCDLDKYSEIGNILNQYQKQFVNGNNYLDLGTWTDYNKYLSNTVNFSNIEIEKKYNANNVTFEDFNQFCDSHLKSSERHEITSADYYFTNNNPNIEFIRYREGSNDEGAVPDITIKNFNNSQLNRFELTIPLKVHVDDTQNVLQFMSLIGLKFEFRVNKQCTIFYCDDFTIVMYAFQVNQKEFKIIEVELHRADFNLITELELLLSNLPGFDYNQTIKQSKFQIIKQELYDTAQQS